MVLRIEENAATIDQLRKELEMVHKKAASKE